MNTLQEKRFRSMLSWMVLKQALNQESIMLGFRSMLSWMVLKREELATAGAVSFRSMLSWMVLKQMKTIQLI